MVACLAAGSTVSCSGKVNVIRDSYEFNVAVERLECKLCAKVEGMCYKGSRVRGVKIVSS